MMLTRRAPSLLLLGLAAAGIGCTDAEPTTVDPVANLVVIIATTGVDVDEDGFSVHVGSLPPRPVAINGKVVFEQLAPGTYGVRLEGLADNCTVSGDNPREVSVGAAGAAVTFIVACVGPTGARVTIQTGGHDMDPDGYGLVVDGQVRPERLATDDAILLDSLAAGVHSFELAGIAGNCATAQPNRRTAEVVWGAVTEVRFQVDCKAFGMIRFTTTTSGPGPEAYTVRLSLPGRYTRTVSAPANGTVTIGDLFEGDHALALTDLPVNCEGVPGVYQTVAAAFGQVSEASLDVECQAVTQLAFASGPYYGGVYDVYLINSNGMGQVQILSGAHADLAWSPDGSRIAFSRTEAGNRDIYLMNADGSDVVRVTDDPATDREPAWSPDGSRMAFVSGRDGTDIYTMNVDGSDLVRVTTDAGGESDPAWSPDGTGIAFVRDGDVHLMNADGSELVRITASGSTESGPAWSPDGSRIAFASLGDDCYWYCVPEIYVANADASGLTQLTNASYGTQLTWSPDGRWIAFTDHGSWYYTEGIRAIEVDGSRTAWILTQEGDEYVDIASPVWRP